LRSIRARQSKGGGEEDQPNPLASRNSSEKAELMRRKMRRLRSRFFFLREIVDV